MPVSAISVKHMVLGGGAQSNVTITTAGVDAELTACACDVSLLATSGIVKAWLEIQAGMTNSFAGANNIATGTLAVSSDDGGTFPTTGMTFSNVFGTANQSVIRAWCDFTGKTDITADVKAAILAGKNLKYKLLAATAANNNLLLWDVSVLLHVVYV